MKRRIPIKIAVAFASIVACANAQRSADIDLTKWEPFKDLSAVRLGLSPESLQTLRPGLRLEKYTGFVEFFGPVIRRYRFSHLGSGEFKIDSRLLQIVSTTSVPSEAEAVARWKLAIEAIEKSNGSPNLCARDSTVFHIRHFAEWVVGSNILDVVYRVPVRLNADSAQVYTSIGLPPQPDPHTVVPCSSPNPE